jgi:hypothetical protein
VATSGGFGMSFGLSKETTVCYHASDRRQDHLANKIAEGAAPERFVANEKITVISPSLVPLSLRQSTF